MLEPLYREELEILQRVATEKVRSQTAGPALPSPGTFNRDTISSNIMRV